MNLATRCTTCGTIFRVVQDQLRVSEGWVRCGRCAEVFDAREQLFDLEQDSPPPWPPQGAPAGTPAPRSAVPTESAAPSPLPSRPMPPVPAPQMAPQAMPPTAPPMAPRQAPQQPPALPPAPQQPSARPGLAPAVPRVESINFAPPPARAPQHFRPSEPLPLPPAPQDSGWITNDDHELNPFAPPRPMPEEDLDAEPFVPRRRTTVDTFAPGPSHPHFADSALRREPFLESASLPRPAPTPPSRDDLPEPKGMRFEEDDLPPPMTDDERPDVLLALSPATAAQLDSQMPDVDAPAAGSADASAETNKPKKRSLFKRAKKPKPAAPAAAMTMLPTELPGDSVQLPMPQLLPTPPAAPEPPPTAVPSFMRKAESAQRWQRPWVRVALGGVSVVLVLTLAGQGLWHAREAVAAQYPVTRPALTSVAQALGQELKPWRHIEALSVESSSLNPAGGGNQFKLTLNLRNRSNWEVAQPWVDLSLTDPGGQLVVRRMLSPTEMQAAKPSLPAGADQQMQVVFDSGQQRIAGYTVELFYP